ncbi:GNAT family N-acetyltransferase [Neptunicella sp. SCSIO 80796]|uniref:GNAT family N-acetyltransferase n=1 Tax=Neptunicella plasticusilytica TaxID=3117012 RepID=UPI003A4DE443
MQLVQLKPEQSREEITDYVSRLFRELGGEEMVPSEQAFDRMFEQWTKDMRHWAYKLMEGEELVGFFTLAESFSCFAHGRYGVINEVWVAPAYRSQGAGKKMMGHIKEFASLKGWKRLDVTAPAEDEWFRSYAFYQQNGFKLTGKKLKFLL